VAEENDSSESSLTLKGLKYGFLNDVSDTGMEGSTDRRRSQGVDYLRSAINSNYQRRALEKIAIFTGIVIAVGEKISIAARNPDVILAQNALDKSWLSNNDGETVKVYKVYIPEIECRPAPASYNDPIIATYYDVYSSLSTGFFKKEPTVGSVVSVRFDNLNNFSGPRIIAFGKTIAFLDDVDGNLASLFGGGGAAGGAGHWMGPTTKNRGKGTKQFADAFKKRSTLKCDAKPNQAQKDVAAALNIDVEVIMAIGAVESGGRSGPVLRFEPHLFHKKAPAGQRSQIPFTPHSPPPTFSRVGSETKKAAFDHAYKVNPKVAIESTSWGAYQVLGGHLLKKFGPDPARALAAYYDAPDDASYVLLQSWMEGSPKARSAAQQKDFVSFAGYYNGGGPGGGQSWKYGGAIAREYNAITCGKNLQVAPNPEDPQEPTPGAVLYLADSQHAAGYSFGGLLRKDLTKAGVPYIINMAKTGRGISAGAAGVISNSSLKNEFEARATKVKPKYAIVGLGGNDAGFSGGGSENDYKTKFLKPLVDSLKGAGIEKIIWLGATKPSVPDKEPTGEQKYYKKPEELARRANIRRWQAEYLPSLGVTYINMESLTQTRQTADGVHYTSAGYSGWYNAAKNGVLKGPIDGLIAGVKSDMAAAESAAAEEGTVQEEENSAPQESTAPA
tara:strand:+ start:3517 stop:5532 length:2016 start_codon:yes stop_codon:yes gene_type:complete